MTSKRSLGDLVQRGLDEGSLFRQACRMPITRSEWTFLVRVVVGVTCCAAGMYFVATLLAGGKFSSFIVVALLALPGLLATAAMLITLRRMDNLRSGGE